MDNQLTDNGSSFSTPEQIEALEMLREQLQGEVDANDLGRLAQLHTGCQTLASGNGVAGELAAAVANLLEGVILKETPDADAGVAAISGALQALYAGRNDPGVDLSQWLVKVQATSKGEPAPEPAAVAAPETPPATEPDPAPEAPSAQSAPAKIKPYVSEPLRVDLTEKDHLDGFIEESQEHMDSIESALLEVEQDPANSDKINELFRPFHTIKGIAGFLNLRDINRLTHEMETILDLARRGELRILPETIDLFFSGIDVLKVQLGSLANFLAAPTDGPVPQPDIVEIMGRLCAAANCQIPPPSAAAPSTTSDPSASTAPENPAATTAPANENTNNISADKESGALNQLADASIRVDTGKLDFLVDAVGELVIAQTMVNLNPVVGGDEKLARNVSQVTKIVRDVQETAMAMRMVPIGHTFQKMRRLVRDVSRKAGKQVELRINGEETELDKNVIQAISDPLVHMVRNAVDHGIENPSDRHAAGKPVAGIVELNAHHSGDSIVIEIRDDGRGLDRNKLIAKGVERGLVSPGDQLTDQQAYGLVIQPGFSTAEKITDISGRGVGMDVVKKNIDTLRGKIEIESELGRGSTFTIRLPLTLAIIDGMLVGIGDERLIIPTVMIEQTLRPEENQITQVLSRGTMIQVRGELIPVIQLGALFGYCEPLDPTTSAVVIAQTETDKIGIVVEELVGQQQVVIKTLGERFKQARGISGAAILGDGRVGLILEPGGLLGLHNSCVSPAYSKEDVNVPSEEEEVENSRITEAVLT